MAVLHQEFRRIEFGTLLAVIWMQEYMFSNAKEIEMNMQEIRGIAKNLGIKTSRMSKAGLIQAIQLAEGNFSCFATAVDGECDQLNCMWRDDCFAAARKLHR